MRNAAAVVLSSAVLIAACQKTSPRETAPPPAPMAKAPAAAPKAPTRPTPRMDRRPAAAEGIARGPATALITIVEFADFQCSYCAQAQPIIDRVMKEYDGKVRVLYRHLPLLGVNDDAVKAAEASMAAEAQGKFWPMHDLLFANQKAQARPDLEKYARKLKLDLGRFKTDLDSHKYLPKIQADMAAAQELGAKFTPVFFINGRPLGGAQPFEQWKLIIDDELAAAGKLMAAGLPANKVYERLMQDAAMPGVKPAAPVAASSTVHKVPIGRAATRGGRQPKVTIVEFCEFQCPYCKSVQPTLQKVLETHPEDVQLVWKHLPLPMHRNAAMAALAAEAAGTQGKFWEMHDKLFANQAALDRPSLETYAQELGLDGAKFKTSLDTIKPDNLVDGDAKEARRFGQSGTPAFFINGRLLVGAQPFESFEKAIAEEIAKADAKLAAGVPRQRLYDELTKDGLDKAEAPPAAHEVARGGPAPDVAYRVDLGDAPVRGAKDAPVTVVVFSDFECPFCAKVEPTLARLMETYKGKVRVAWKDFPLPFHPNAVPAAVAARAAGAQGKFWEMHDRLFSERTLDRASLIAHAKALRLNLAKFEAALDSAALKAAVQADTRQGAGIGVSGTPAFYVNGVFLSGALPYESFQAAVDQQLKKAQAMIAGGTPAGKVYETIMKTAQTSVVAAAREGAAPGGAAAAVAEEPVVPIEPGDSPSRGPRNAPITIVLFSDFECPFCGKVEPSLERLEKEYPGKIRVVWKNYPLPFHANARPAAAAALAAADQGKFWPMHAKLFENQRALDRASLERYAGELGLNLPRFKAALDSNKFGAVIDAETKVAVGAGVTGTPASFINGRKIEGAVPYEAFKAMVDQELSRTGPAKGQPGAGVAVRRAGRRP